MDRILEFDSLARFPRKTQTTLAPRLSFSSFMPITTPKGCKLASNATHFFFVLYPAKCTRPASEIVVLFTYPLPFSRNARF